MRIVTVALNALDQTTWTRYEVENVCEFLLSQFETFPETARIYHKFISDSYDITPKNEADIDRLNSLDGDIFVIVYPAELTTAAYVAAAIIVAAIVLATSKKPPIPTVRNAQTESPNNSISERTNNARPNARIPDIYGEVRSTPDLISVPYKVFEDNVEVEQSYMCIGRGSYEISPDNIFDDTTRLSEIDGSSAEIYKPFTSPNSGDAPQLRIGNAINERVLSVSRSNAVNGQVLSAPNSKYVKGDSSIRFVSPNIIELHPNQSLDFSSQFASGDSITVINAFESSSYISETRKINALPEGAIYFVIPSATLPPQYQPEQELRLGGAQFSQYDNDGFLERFYDLSGVYRIDRVLLESVQETDELGAVTTKYYCKIFLKNPSAINSKWAMAMGSIQTDAILQASQGVQLYNLDGSYKILSVSQNTIILDNPSAINKDWLKITTTNYISPIIASDGVRWIGSFVLPESDLSKIFANFVAPNGLFKDDGVNQQRVDVTLEVEVTPINIDGTARGAPEIFQTTIQGSSITKDVRATTLKASVSFTGRCKVRARRITPSDLGFEGTVSDEIKWRDLYSVSETKEAHFGDVTTVQSKTYTTSGSLVLKDRKLNMIVTRKLPKRVSNSFTAELYPTKNAADIISAICLDKKIGNRTYSEVDFNVIYSEIEKAKNYFGSEKAIEFCYTFDTENLSFEETIKAIADAVFCTAYRRGNVIKLAFEQKTIDSTLLFNHRNKIPSSETRTVTFGNQDGADGVVFKYIDPSDDAQVNIYLPDKSSINPKEIDSLGVRNSMQAHFHAYRALNKIKYQNVSVEFTATQEADVLVNNDRILLADNTRTGTFDGEVEAQDLLTLTLSQEVDLSAISDPIIFLQMSDGTIDSISITQGANKKQVILANAPKIPLALEKDLYARTTYIITGRAEARENAFLVSEKDPQSNFTTVVRAINYDDRYYQNDKDHVNGSI